MARVMDWIKSVIFSGADDDTDDTDNDLWEPPELPDIERKRLNELKKELGIGPGVDSDGGGGDDDDDDGEGTPTTHERTGIVTGLRSKVGVIDTHFTFDLAIAPADVREGDHVLYRAHRPRGAPHDWAITRVLESLLPLDGVKQILQRRAADEKPRYTGAEERGLPTPDTRDARCVTRRDARRVTLDDGALAFDLDAVHAQFSPLVGDFLFVDVDGGVGGAVTAVRWLGHGLVTGVVTAWDNVDGVGRVGENTCFYRDACISGYSPSVDDEVNAEVIFSHQPGGLRWRALELTAVQAVRTSNKRNGYAPSGDIVELCRFKMGVHVNTRQLHFGRVLLDGAPVERVVRITNRYYRSHLLESGGFYLAGHQFQVAPVDEVKRRWLAPGETAEFRFRCVGRHIGYSKELFVFCFKLFRIGVHFELEVLLTDLDHMVSEHSRSDRKCVFYQGLRMTRTDAKDVIPGERPIQPPKFIAERLGMFNILERFWDAVLDENNVLKPIPEVQAAIEVISPSLSQDLNYQNYRERFHSLLYLEEIDGNLKLGKCSMRCVRMTAVTEGVDNFLELVVPGLAEKRPSLLVGDKVLATYPWADEGGANFEGFVHKTFARKIWLKFSPVFHVHHATQPDAEFNIQFEFGRTAIRRQHAGLETAARNLGEQILFPTRLDVRPPQVDVPLGADERRRPASGRPAVRWINPMLNENQKEVIRNVLRGEARPLPYLIFGPPGTGKTVTLVELILQIRTLLPESRVLVATPSNSSANLIAERLIDSRLLQAGDLVRLVGYHMFLDGSLSPTLLPFSTTGNIKMLTRGDERAASSDAGIQQSSNRHVLGRHRVTVGTCVALGQLITMGFPQGHFTHLVVDEAGQATEPEILVPMGLMLITGQTVLAGDPLQLGPVVGSNLASQYGLGESYLDRLIHRFPYQRDSQGFPETGGYDPRLVSRLVNNYRSLPEILALPNRLFYENHLMAQVCARSSAEAALLSRLSRVLPRRDSRFGGPPSIVFHGVVGANLQDRDSPSWFNVQEVGVVAHYVAAFYEHAGLQPEDVGVITPYRQQIKKLRAYLERNGVPLPKIGSVEEFQGQERKVIVMSAVRSTLSTSSTDVIHSLGFVASAKRLNVALTRAQCLLVMVGNPHVLMQDVYWRATVEYCLARGSFTGCSPPLSCNPRLNSELATSAAAGATSMSSEQHRSAFDNNGAYWGSPQEEEGGRLRRTANLLYSNPSACQGPTTELGRPRLAPIPAEPAASSTGQG